MRFRVVFAVIAAAGVVGTATPADIYRTVAPDGSVHYSDTPSTPASQAMPEAPAPAPTAAELSRDAARQVALENIARRRLEKDMQERGARKAYDEQRCRQARELSAYFQKDAVTRRIEKGDARPFYTATEIQQRRAAAKLDLARYCPR